MQPELPITPDTKVAALLDAYPALEDVLMRLSPMFAKLKNPVLRRTVARLATLGKAAKVAGIDCRTLLTELRRAAGQDTAVVFAEETPGAAMPPPAWLDLERVTAAMDADLILARGQMPFEAILTAIARAPMGGIIRLDATFEPAPLVDLLVERGLQHYLERTPKGRFVLYVLRPGGCSTK